MRRTFVVLGAMLTALAMSVGAASADPGSTVVIHNQPLLIEGPLVYPGICVDPGPDATLAGTISGVSHVGLTGQPGMQILRSQFVAVVSGTLTSSSGSWTFRENVSSANTQFFSEFPVTYTMTYVATIHLFDAAGQGAPFSLHVHSHATLTGNGTITVSFFDTRLDCGA
jgi:hypothetical protein